MVALSRQTLLDFLDERAFLPVENADPLSYVSPGDRKLLKSVQRRVHETRMRYSQYPSASAIKTNFIQDLNSKAGQTLAADLWLLKLSRFEDIQEEFRQLCNRLGL
jgi:hypothetical protein